MYAAAAVCSVLVLTAPSGYEVDFRPMPDGAGVPGPYRLTLVTEDFTDRKLSVPIEFSSMATRAVIVDAVINQLEHEGWVVRQKDAHTLIVMGTERAPAKRVEFRGPYTPAVRPIKPGK